MFRFLAQLLVAGIKRAVFIPLGWVVPKDPRRIVFAGGSGRSYRGNSRYLFEHALEQGGFDCFWLTRSRSVFREVERAHPGRVLDACSIRGLVGYLRAAVVVVTHGQGDVAPFYAPWVRKVFVNLWHGTPLKRIGYLYPGDDWLRRREHLSTTRYLCCASDFERFVFAACFRIDVERIWITGAPRNDRLLAEVRAPSPLDLPLRGKTILYAPTFRDRGAPVRFFPFDDFDREALEAFLATHDAVLLVRGHYDGHYDDVASEPTSPSGGSRIQPARSDVIPDVQEILPHVDVLITDYSGIYFDFLLLDRPIIFIPYDIDDYQRERGFLYDYDQFTPGSKVATQAELLAALERGLELPESAGEERRRVRDLFHRYQDGGACQRVLGHIERELARTWARPATPQEDVAKTVSR